MLSFVIPAHNEESLLGATLNAIHEAARGCDLSAYEIVVANDTSTDRTAEVAVERGARVVTIDKRHIAAARNAGARAAAGEVLIFVDADTLLTPGTLRGALTALEAGAAAGGGAVVFDGEVPRYARVILPVILWLFRVVRMAGGCFIFCRRDAFDAIGGWDESVYASEELLFANAIKHRYGRRRFVVLREAVMTSGRKLRTHTPRELFGPLLGVAIRGKRGLASRDRLGVWYDPRRADPGAPS